MYKCNQNVIKKVQLGMTSKSPFSLSHTETAKHKVIKTFLYIYKKCLESFELLISLHHVDGVVKIMHMWTTEADNNESKTVHLSNNVVNFCRPSLSSIFAWNSTRQFLRCVRIRVWWERNIEYASIAEIAKTWQHWTLHQYACTGR